MAYMGRGGFSSFKIEKPDIGKNINEGGARMHHGGGLGPSYVSYYYIPLDNTYVIFQMIATFIILATTVITFLITYKPTIIDPISNTKKIIINSYISISLILIVLILIANSFSKSKKSLTKKLIILLIISVLTIFIFYGIKMNIKSTYLDFLCS